MIKTSLIYSFYAWVKNVIRCVLGYLKFSSIYHSFVTLRPHRAKINLDVLIIGGGNSFTDEMSFYIREHRASFVIVVINHYYKNSLSRFLIPDYYLVSDPRVIMPSNDADVSDNERLKRYIRRHSVKLITPYSKLWLKKYSPDLFFNDDQCLHALSRQPYFPRPIPSNSLL